MDKRAARPATVEPVEAALRAELAHADLRAASVAPVLRHLLAGDDQVLFADEIVARVRGMLDDLVRQLLQAIAAPFDDDRSQADQELASRLNQALADSPALLAHLHSLALEWQVTERLQFRLALDPVLTPLVEALIGSAEPETAALAMRLLASQARFAQAQRRMQLPLAELPGDLLHGALVAFGAMVGGDTAIGERIGQAERAIRGGYDEGRTRLGLISRLIAGMGGGALAALRLDHAGVAIFASALAFGAHQERDTAVLALHESQIARLALALRAAGLKPGSIEEQLIALHPDIVHPTGLDRIGPERAAALLALAGVPEDL
ncbi:MAG: hypothetical protein JF593_02475 [Novosphingobium sp.]|nr:hypothetical protein [Novosphingobium sp.]